MHNTDSDATDRLVRNERRGVWMALIVVLGLAATMFVDSDTRHAFSAGLVVAIVFAVIWLSQSATRRLHGDVRKDRSAVMQDELRAAAMAGAYKWAFFSMVGALAVFCMLSTVMTVELSAATLSALAIALGVSVFLGLFLLFDRV